MYNGIGTIEEDLKLCAMERTNQAEILVAAIVGYFAGKKL